MYVAMTKSYFYLFNVFILFHFAVKSYKPQKLKNK